MVQKSILKNNAWKVFEVFVDEPMKIHYIKEISRKIRLAHTSVMKYLKDLEREGLIKKEKGDIFQGYKSDRDNKDFLFYKKVFNLMKIKESDILDYLIDALYPKTVILYGSYLRGEDVEGSDIDMFIVSKVGKKIDVEKFEKILNRKIHIMVERDFNRLNKELKGEVLNGLVLYGYLDLKNG